MAKRSVRWPIRLVGGRVPLTDSTTTETGDRSESLRQIVRHRCLDGASRNPFRREVEAGDLVFEVLDSNGLRRAEARIRSALAPLEVERRAKIVSIRATAQPGSGKINVAVSYIDLEVGERRELEIAR